MASLLKRGSKFYIRVYVNGKAKDIATKTTNIKIAEKLLQKVEYENATGQLATATRTPLTYRCARSPVWNLARSSRHNSGET